MSLKFNLSSAAHKVDVMFLADSTGSMYTAMENVKANFLNAYKAFQTQTKWDVGVGIAYYKDVTDPDPFKVLTKITTDHTTIQNAVNSLTPSGGGDTPEGQLYALQQLSTTANSGWRIGATRILAWFGDEPGHDPSNGVTLKAAEYDLGDHNIYVCAFSMAPSNDLDSTGQATAITNYTNGVTGGQYVKSNVQQAGVTTTIFDFIGDHVF